MKGSVKIMLSYDYSHFEVALSSDKELDTKGVNELRKTAQRLADEAVRQYKKARAAAAERQAAAYGKESLLREVERIKAIPEAERTVWELASLKEYESGKALERDYDYDDDRDFGEDEMDDGA